MTRAAEVFKEFLAAKGLSTTPMTANCRKRSAEDMVIISGNPKKKERRGDRTIMGRDTYRRKKPQEKLLFVQENYDENYKDYTNEDRQWLLRVKKIYKCLSSCCKGDPKLFLDRHGGPIYKAGKCEMC